MTLWLGAALGSRCLAAKYGVSTLDLRNLCNVLGDCNPRKKPCLLPAGESRKSSQRLHRRVFARPASYTTGRLTAEPRHLNYSRSPGPCSTGTVKPIWLGGPLCGRQGHACGLRSFEQRERNRCRCCPDRAGGHAQSSFVSTRSTFHVAVDRYRELTRLSRFSARGAGPPGYVCRHRLYYPARVALNHSLRRHSSPNRRALFPHARPRWHGD